MQWDVFSFNVMYYTALMGLQKGGRGGGGGGGGGGGEGIGLQHVCLSVCQPVINPLGSNSANQAISGVVFPLRV